MRKGVYTLKEGIKAKSHLHFFVASGFHCYLLTDVWVYRYNKYPDAS